jgi:uncharacterized membrane protein YoaK (UPF0700 family)
MFTPLFDAESVHQRRNLFAWGMLCMASGAVNSSSLAACGRLITHMTGIATRVGADVGKWKLLGEYAMVFSLFVLGGFLASLLVLSRGSGGRDGDRRGFFALFGAEALLLAAVAIAGHQGAFGPFGQTVETYQDFVLLGILAFISGLQNAVVSVATGNAVRTTHVTGPATDLAVFLAQAVSGGATNRKTARRHVRLRLVKIGSFVLGGVIAPLCASRVDYLVFLAPIVPLAVGVFVAFPRERATPSEESSTATS